jgi:hypothetical protein
MMTVGQGCRSGGSMHTGQQLAATMSVDGNVTAAGMEFRLSHMRYKSKRSDYKWPVAGGYSGEMIRTLHEVLSPTGLLQAIRPLWQYNGTPPNEGV